MEAKSNTIELIEYFIWPHLTLCCTVLPRLTVMSHSADYNPNFKPRCLGFRKPRALCSFYRLYSTLRCGHFHITDGPCEGPLQPSKIEERSLNSIIIYISENQIHREASLIRGALTFPLFHWTFISPSLLPSSHPSATLLDRGVDYSGPWPACSLQYGLDVRSWIGPF